MEPRTIQITENDLDKLSATIREAKLGEYRNSIYIQHLEDELKRAHVVTARQIPADVITMNSHVILIDVATSEPMELILVFPEDSGKHADAVSILAPIGTAMIGYRVGDVFEWETPAGKTSFRVDKILYQPESSGIFD